MSKWAVGFLLLLVLIAVFGGGLANDRPLVAGVDGRVVFPALFDHPVAKDGDAPRSEWAIWPPIRFTAEELGAANSVLRPPLSVTNGRGRHWLGTDSVGRDVAAGLVAGSRVAVVVGFGSLLVSLLIGLPLGGMAGFFGNRGLRAGAGWLIAGTLALVVGVGYTWISLRVVFPGWLALVPGALLVVLLTLLIGGALTLLPAFRTKVSVPLDRLVVGLLEIVGSVPGLVFLLALLTYLERPGLPTVVLVIGLLGWTSIARFVRAELMRIRELPYISAARVGGVGELRLLIVHALPNALGPVAVTAAFVVGGSILLESMLSFLGIGVPAGQVSWGSMLQESRTYPSAWWLAVFPGVLLSLTVLACNSLRR